jgi:hypothetical protein
MKTRFLIFSNLITFSLLLFFSCRRNFTSEQSNSSNCEYDTASLINLETARGLSYNYKQSLESLESIYRVQGNERGQEIERIVNDQNSPLKHWVKDARSSWFSYNDLTKFLCAMRRDIGDSISRDKLGIRVYYGRYPDRTNFRGQIENVDSQNEYKHCVFFVPTVNQKLKNGTFDVDFVKEVGKENTIFSSKNHGNLVPPHGYDGSAIYNHEGSIIF